MLPALWLALVDWIILFFSFEEMRAFCRKLLLPASMTIICEIYWIVASGIALLDERNFFLRLGIYSTDFTEIHWLINANLWNSIQEFNQSFKAVMKLKFIQFYEQQQLLTRSQQKCTAWISFSLFRLWFATLLNLLISLQWFCIFCFTATLSRLITH